MEKPVPLQIFAQPEKRERGEKSLEISLNYHPAPLKVKPVDFTPSDAPAQIVFQLPNEELGALFK
jgi:hypothetical protein